MPGAETRFFAGIYFCVRAHKAAKHFRILIINKSPVGGAKKALFLVVEWWFGGHK